MEIYSKQKTNLIIGLTAFLALTGCLLQYKFGFFFWGRHGFAIGNDDAFISFRYAKNIIDHGVLSFNINDNPRVEGFSNPLHVAICAVVYALTSTEMVYPVIAMLGIAAAVTAFILSTRHAAQRFGISGAVAVGFGFALSPSLWIHAGDGLETPFVLLLQVLVWTCAFRLIESENKRDTRILLISSILLVLLRTDGFVLPSIVGIWLIFQRRPDIALKCLAAMTIAFLVVLGARLMYYGQIWPNTYYAKINGSLIDRLIAAGRLLGSMFYKNGFIVPFAGAFAAGALQAWESVKLRRIVIGIEVWIFAALISYYLLIGGDIYRERFLVILYPIGFIAGLEFFNSKQSLQYSYKFAAIAVIMQFSAFHFDPRLSWKFDSNKWDRFVFLGKYMAATYPNLKLATGAAGKIPYFSNLDTIDMLGLNDIHIARTPAHNANSGHGRYDAEYVLSKRPQIISDHAFGDGDLAYDMNRVNYEAHGYLLAHLVRSEDTIGPEIVNTIGKKSTEIKTLIDSGYTWGVLVHGSILKAGSGRADAR